MVSGFLEKAFRIDVLFRFTSFLCNRFRGFQLHQSVQRCLGEIVGISRTEAFGGYISNAGSFHDGSDSTAGDDAGSFGRRLDENPARTESSHDTVRDGVVQYRHVDEIFSCLFDRFPNGIRHLVCLAETHANATVPVPDDDHGIEAEPSPSLHDLGNTVMWMILSTNSSSIE